MKTISIEQCTNGWIVRPFSACEGWARGELQAIAVFNNMHELQAALPQFFEMPDPLVPVRRDLAVDDGPHTCP